MFGMKKIFCQGSGYISLVVCCIILVIPAFGQNQKANQKAISYPTPLAGDNAIVFLPGIVSGNDNDFGAAFSPDGRSFYFSRTINKLSGIMVSRFIKGRWAEPVPVAFAKSHYADADPAFSPDGKLYFISTRPVSENDTTRDYNIWFVTPAPDGNWSYPQPLAEVNSEANEYYISFATNGNLYFASSRPGGFGEEDIYVSKREEERFTKPINLGPTVNTAKSEYDPFISGDEKLLIFTSSGRAEGIGGADLYSIKLAGDAVPRLAVNLGPLINTSGREYCPYISPDGKYFFYSSGEEIKWIKFSALKQLPGIN
jgi:Tol biopolymer transport system component